MLSKNHLADSNNKKFKGDKYPIIKGVIIAIFAILSLVSFIMALLYFK